MPIRKLNILVLLALSSQVVLFTPTVEAVNDRAIRSRLNNISENVETHRQSENQNETDHSLNASSESINLEGASESSNEYSEMSEPIDVSVEDTPLDEVTAKAYLDEQRISGFIKALGDLETLEHYQINYTLTDTQTEETIAEGDFVGNQAEGDLMGRIAYHFPKASPKQYDFEFISYRNFDLAYVKLFELLDSMAFFKQPYFNLAMQEQIAELKDRYVAIESAELNRVNLQRDPFKALLMMPDLNRLSRISGANLYTINDVYLLSLERLEIPEYLFRHSTNFGLNFNLALKIEPAAQTDNHINWNVTSDQRFELSEKDNSLNFKVAVNSELSELMLPPVPEGSQRVKDNFSRQMTLDNNVMLDKLTKVNMVYNASTQTYRMSLVGIVEQIEFNFFSDEAAGLETTEYRLDYTIKPIERELPKLDDIKKMNAAEADYILEELLNN